MATTNATNNEEMEVEEEMEIPSELETLSALETVNQDEAMAKYLAITMGTWDPQDLASLKRKEVAINRLGFLYAKNNRVGDLKNLVQIVRPIMDQVSKAKGGKMFRTVLDQFLSLKGVKQEQVVMCLEGIEWANAQKRKFLRQALQMRLSALHLDTRAYQPALAVIQPLVRELKTLDDKPQLVEVQLMESQAYYNLSNYPKSRASLVSARTTANSIYCAPRMQAALDLQSGILHAQEKDFKTAYSYFYESFESFDSVDIKDKAMVALKYMLLCKVLLNDAGDIPSILAGKLALKYYGGEDKQLEAMQAVATASMKRSLADFEKALLDYHSELSDDSTVQAHVAAVYDNLLQKNLLRIVELFSRVEIAHISKLINLRQEVVEKKLSQMILDKELNGILDQRIGCLQIFDQLVVDKTCVAALDTIVNCETVVEALNKKSMKLYA